MDAGEFFSVQWPEIVPRLRAMLARAGAPVSDREDLVQETALRLLRSWDTVDQQRPVEPLARQIAMNAWRDQWRRRGEREVLGNVPELVCSADTERTAMARVEVREVSRALSTLSVGTAQVLRIAAGEAEDGRPRAATSASVRMARSRARRALLSCLEAASAAIMGVVAGLRSLRRSATTGTTVGAMATIACVLTLSSSDVHGAPTTLNDGAAVPAVQSAQLETAETPMRPVTKTDAGPGSSATRRRAAHKTTAEPDYYVINAGPAQAKVFVDVNLGGYGGKISQTPSDASPVCLRGVPLTTPVTPRCADR